MSRRLTVAASVLGIFLVSGLTMALPLASAQSTVAVSMPSGAGSPNGAPGYSPDTITLVIGVNNTVTWTNNDSAHHTVTSVSGNGSISSGDMAPGATFTYTFTTPGTYQYYCVYHSWMTGTVVVKAGSAPPPAGLTISMPSGAGSPNGAPGYSPDTITLVIGVNATVNWINNDSAHHTVTSVSGNGSISSGDMAPGATFTYTFTTPGTYQYYCVYHSWMTGVVIVKAASTVPEFPAAYLALTLFAAIAAVVVVAPRLRPMLSPGAASGTTKG